jgi:hypothetical protein
MAMVASGVMLGGRASNVVGASVFGTNERLVCVGISATLMFIVEIRKCAREAAPAISGNQVTIVTNQVTCLAAARPMKRNDDALEEAAAHRGASRRFTAERYVA